MHLTQRKGVWYVRFDHNGKDVKLSTKETDKGIARVKALDLMRDYLTDNSKAEERESVEKRSALNLGWALQVTLTEHWQGLSYYRSLKYLVPVLQKEVGHWPLDATDYNRLRDYTKGLLKDGYAASTINKRTSAIRKAMQHMADFHGFAGRLPKVPRLEEANERIRWLRDDEEDVLFGFFRKRAFEADVDVQPEWALTLALSEFLVDTGLRLSEAFKFRVEPDGDGVYLKGGLTEDGRKKTKSGKGRSVPLTDRAKAALRVMLDSPIYATLRSGDSPKDHDRRWAWYDHRFSQSVGAGKLEDVSIHILRHTCASRLVQRGVDLYVVKNWMGHQKIETTLRYAHLAPSNLTGALAALQRKPVALTVVPTAPKGAQEQLDKVHTALIAETLGRGSVSKAELLEIVQRACSAESPTRGDSVPGTRSSPSGNDSPDHGTLRVVK
jgi:integrase